MSEGAIGKLAISRTSSEFLSPSLLFSSSFLDDEEDEEEEGWFMEKKCVE